MTTPKNRSGSKIQGSSGSGQCGSHCRVAKQSPQGQALCSRSPGANPLPRLPASVHMRSYGRHISIASAGSQLAHAGMSREDNWRKITVQAQSDGKYGNQAVDGRTAPTMPVCAVCLPVNGQRDGSMCVILSESQDNRKKVFSDRWMTGAQEWEKTAIGHPDMPGGAMGNDKAERH
ncbi:hypothetical protein EYF80_000769 [Liparis tanakae]|uniref:Uncharacterized protein n=1 Tax=Liparis tanakae TaxID=230148 RepID=A0A4Z2JFY9_9TELE|nr:hypothetical protein EYF80_000769 [Liparis tanakae]